MTPTEGKPEALRLADRLDGMAGWVYSTAGGNASGNIQAAAALLRSQHAELEALRADAKRRDRIELSMADVISNHCIAMQSAVIDGHLRSPAHGLQWIVNTLYGPGLLPDLEKAKALGSAQAWFDAETAKEEADRARRIADTARAGEGEG